MENQETKQDTRPLVSLRGDEQTIRLTRMVQQAYFRRSRQLPANVAEMVECLKGDLLRSFPDCPVNVVDEAITTSTLHDNATPLSVTFFFTAVKSRWFTPKTNRHQWDNEDPNRRPDFEGDTIALLDACAAALVKKAATEPEEDSIGQVLIHALPTFKPEREYSYLVLRGQLADDSWRHYLARAIVDINAERIKARAQRVDKDKADEYPDVVRQAQRHAVTDWLNSCVIAKTTPSAVLSPLADEPTYRQWRKGII